jgi:hypothetical protein
MENISSVVDGGLPPDHDDNSSTNDDVPLALLAVNNNNNNAAADETEDYDIDDGEEEKEVDDFVFMPAPTTNIITLETIRDNIVSDGTLKTYLADILQFLFSV